MLHQCHHFLHHQCLLCFVVLAAHPLMPGEHLQVADRAVVKTADAERKVVQPEGLQASIDQAVKVVPSGQTLNLLR